jgi:hypothetical protein
MTQPFRSGDHVDVLLGPTKGERWVIAVYDETFDTAYIAGWPCTMVTKASVALKRVEACDDLEHARMVKAVSEMRGDYGGGDPRRSALLRVQERGGTP